MPTDDPPDDISMILRGFGGKPLATRRIALALAELLIAEDGTGRTRLEYQRPFMIDELADRWAIKSQRRLQAKAAALRAVAFRAI